MGCGSYVDDGLDDGHDGVDNSHEAGGDGRDQRVELGGLSGLYILVFFGGGKAYAG